MKTSPEVLAQLILQVRAGSLTATAAARQLGISRKTYYQWEARGLQGLVAALQPGQAGRPLSPPETEQQRLAQENQRLQQELEAVHQRLHIQERLALADTSAKKK